MNYTRLGRLAKQTHPGKYDDYTDDELGEDLAEEGYTETDFQTSLVPMGNTSLDKSNAQTLQVVEQLYQEIQRKASDYSNDTGLFPKWKKTTTDNRTALNLARVQEIGSLLEIARKLDEIRSQEQNRITSQIATQVGRAELALRGRTAELAASLGMSVVNYESYIAKKIEIDAEVVKAQALADIDIDKARQIATIETKKEVDLGNLKFDIRTKEQKLSQEQETFTNEEQLTFTNRATTLKSHEEIKTIQRDIDDFNKRIDDLEAKAPLSERKKKELDNLVRTVDVFYEEIRVIEEGLRKTDVGEKPKRTRVTKTKPPEDPR